MQVNQHVVLVDRDDVPVGTAEKMRAHRLSLLHRAFSVFVFDGRGRLLMQRRAPDKYHSGGLWSNTVCSHPRPGESPADAAHRRLIEEMGFDCVLEPVFSFIYRADVGAGLHEHELDHVFTGTFDGDPIPNPAEADAWRWIDPEELRHELATRPGGFTYWFRIAFAELDRRGLVPAGKDPFIVGDPVT